MLCEDNKGRPEELCVQVRLGARGWDPFRGVSVTQQEPILQPLTVPVWGCPAALNAADGEVGWGCREPPISQC